MYSTSFSCLLLSEPLALQSTPASLASFQPLCGEFISRMDGEKMMHIKRLLLCCRFVHCTIIAPRMIFDFSRKRKIIKRHSNDRQEEGKRKERKLRVTQIPAQAANLILFRPSRMMMMTMINKEKS